MAITVDYYFAPQSPWTYLGHARFVVIAAAAGATVRVLPVDLRKVFAVSGGVPLGQRAAQRQAYRLVELQRFAQYLQLPLNLKPKYFPVPGDDAARLILAVERADGVEPALRLAAAVLSAVWLQERNIADAAVLAQLLHELALPAERLARSRDSAVQQRYEAATQQAIGAAVFGAPSYCVAGEIFWGQDRLDFLERRLQRASVATAPGLTSSTTATGTAP